MKTVDPAAIKECPHALLVMSIFGGFKGIPVTYSPDQITTTVQTLFNKLPKKSKKPPVRDNDDLVERECRMCMKQFSESQNEWLVEKKLKLCLGIVTLAVTTSNWLVKARAVAVVKEMAVHLVKPVNSEKYHTRTIMQKQKPEKPGGSLAEDDDMFSSPDASASTAELLIARPCISMSPWRDQGSEIPCGDVNLIMDGQRDWQAFFRGVLGSFGLYFRGLEIDLGESLDSEAMKCFILSQGLAHGIDPSTILAGYRLDATHCKANLSANSNSLVKMHLDFFKMTSDCGLPDDIEICNDLLQLDAGLSFQVMQILEQAFHAGRATLIIQIGRSVESDKILRASMKFICLVSKSAKKDAPLGILKSERLHCTTMQNFEFSYDGTHWVTMNCLETFLSIKDKIETVSQVSMKLCCNLKDRSNEYNGIQWPEYLPSACHEFGELPDWSSLGRAHVEDKDHLLIPFAVSTAQCNPDLLSLKDLLFAIVDNMGNVSLLAEQSQWSRIEITNFDSSTFLLDDGNIREYNVWLQDSLELQNSATWMKAYHSAFSLVFRSWGFHPDGSKMASGADCGAWRGNILRLYRMARSAWLFRIPSLLSAVQLVAITVSPSRVFRVHDIDFSVLLLFQLPIPSKLGGSSLDPVDIDLLTSSRNIDSLHRMGIANPSEHVTSETWFTFYAQNIRTLTKAIHLKFGDHHDCLALMVRYIRMHHPGTANHGADPVRIVEKFMCDKNVDLDFHIVRRLVRMHRSGSPLHMAATRCFDPLVTNLPETKDHRDLLLKALRKLVVMGMVIIWPSDILYIVKKWPILISPLGIVFTAKKDVKAGGRITQACSANKKWNAANHLTVNADDVLPCSYDGAVQGVRAFFAVRDQLEAYLSSLQNLSPEAALVKANLTNFVALTYVDDNDALTFNGSEIEGGGSDGCHAFSTVSQDEGAVGSISVRLDIVEDFWKNIFGPEVISTYLVNNFGHIHSPGQYQPIGLAIKARVQGANPDSVAALLPGYTPKVEDRPQLMLYALITSMRFAIGYEGKIDFSKTQDASSTLKRLGAVLHLSEAEIDVQMPHLEKTIAALSEVFEFKKQGLPGIPLRWVQRTSSLVRFTACYPHSWMIGFLCMLIRCMSGVSSSAPADLLTSPALPHQDLNEALDSFYRCCSTLLILLVNIKRKPSLGRVPFFMLLPFQEALMRADWSQLGFECMDACDDGFSALLADRNIRNKVEVLLMVWPQEVMDLILKMRNAELRDHPSDFLTMGNLEHFAVVAGDLQWAESSYFKKLMCKITDSQNAQGCINRSFSPNFVDQELRRLASWLKVIYTYSEYSVWVDTEMNLLLDLLSRLFHRNLLQDKVMSQILDFCSDRGIELEFVSPCPKVCVALEWLANKNKPDLSLVHLFEQELEASSVNPVKMAGDQNTAPFRDALINVPSLKLDAFGSCLCSVSEIRALSIQMADSFGNCNYRTATHLACGFGGFTIGATLAGFLPLFSRDNAEAAVVFHSYITGGFSTRGDLTLMSAKRMFATHLLTFGFPCQDYSTMGKGRYDDGPKCLVRIGVSLILGSGAVMFLAECTPALRTAKGGAVWLFICSELKEKYYLLDDTLPLKFFDHSTNRTRFFFVGANKLYFQKSPFSSFPRGHLAAEEDIPGMARCMEECSAVNSKYFRCVNLDPPPPSTLPVAGHLIRLAKVRESSGKGSPEFPNFLNNSSGIATTQLASHYRRRSSDRCFGVNTGLYLRLPADTSFCVDMEGNVQIWRDGLRVFLFEKMLSSSGVFWNGQPLNAGQPWSTDPESPIPAPPSKKLSHLKKPVQLGLPSALTVLEQTRLANFPADTLSTAVELGLNESTVSTGVNGAVPVTVTFTLSSWLFRLMDIAGVPDVLEQSCVAPYDCGYQSVQDKLVSDIVPLEKHKSRIDARWSDETDSAAKMGGKRSLAITQSVYDSTISACHVFGSGDDQFRRPFELWERTLNCWTCGGPHSTSDCNLIINPRNPSTALLCAGLQRSLSPPFPRICKVFLASAASDSSIQGQSIELCPSCVEDIFGSFLCAEDYLKDFHSISPPRPKVTQTVASQVAALYSSDVSSCMMGGKVADNTLAVSSCANCGEQFSSDDDCLFHQAVCLDGNTTVPCFAGTTIEFPLWKLRKCSELVLIRHPTVYQPAVSFPAENEDAQEEQYSPSSPDYAPFTPSYSSGYSPSSPGISPTLTSGPDLSPNIEVRDSPIAPANNFHGCIAIPSGPFVASDLTVIPSSTKRRKVNASAKARDALFDTVISDKMGGKSEKRVAVKLPDPMWESPERPSDEIVGQCRKKSCKMEFTDFEDWCHHEAECLEHDETVPCLAGTFNPFDFNTRVGIIIAREAIQDYTGTSAPRCDSCNLRADPNSANIVKFPTSEVNGRSRDAKFPINKCVIFCSRECFSKAAPVIHQKIVEFTANDSSLIAALPVPAPSLIPGSASESSTIPCWPEPSHKRRKTAQQISDRDALFALDDPNPKMGGKRRKSKN